MNEKKAAKKKWKSIYYNNKITMEENDVWLWEKDNDDGMFRWRRRGFEVLWMGKWIARDFTFMDLLYYCRILKTIIIFEISSLINVS